MIVVLITALTVVGESPGDSPSDVPPTVKSPGRLPRGPQLMLIIEPFSSKVAKCGTEASSPGGPVLAELPMSTSVISQILHSFLPSHRSPQ